MDSTLGAILTLKEKYSILSTKTGRLYIDDNCQCYLFEAERDAKQFCDKFKDTFFKEPELLKQIPFITKCYSFGITNIKVKKASEEKFYNIPVVRSDTSRCYCNRETMFNLLMLKQTKYARYLRNIANVPFLSSVFIDERKEGHYPVLHYSVAEVSDERTYFLLFTDLKEFNSWKSSQIQSDNLLPNETTLQELNKIRNGLPVLINPLSDMLILTNKQINSVTKQEQG